MSRRINISKYSLCGLFDPETYVQCLSISNDQIEYPYNFIAAALALALAIALHNNHVAFLFDLLLR